jgi:two-component system, OmpR family, alkaline phosphatase synthesis response regulator PhoP
MSQDATILVVEDDRSTRMAVVENLRFEGYQVLDAADGERGLETALSKRPDLIILDVMLPKVNGYEICETLRKHGLVMPVLMLTAKGQEYDRVLGLEIGADDYITKPFSVRELMARVKASLRREKRLKSEEAPLEFADCSLDFAKRTLTKGGAEVALTKTEFDLLKYLISRPGHVFSRQALLNAVWGFDYYGTDRTVDRFITVLRKKVEDDPSSPKHIITVHGAGYRFER